MAKGNFGERLKREREMREVSHDELTKATRISPRFLDALENEQWEKLPGGVFGRGFVRTIAHYLGLDEESLLAEYDLARAEQSLSSPAKPEVRIPPPPKWIPVAVLLVIALIAFGLVFAGRYAWRIYVAHRASRQSSASITLGALGQPASVTSTPLNVGSNTPLEIQASPVSLKASSASTRLDLSISTSAVTQVRVLADDKLLLNAELPAGETRHFFASDHFEVTASDSSAVLLELNGQVMQPISAPGSSGTIVLSEKDLRPPSGTSQP
jgi:cytoskeleton protein RodZ